MYKYIYASTMFICSSFLGAADNIPYNFHDESDKTDIFDIPVGDTEYEQEQEMEELDELSEEEQTKRK